MAHGSEDTVHPDIRGDTGSCLAAADCLLTSWYLPRIEAEKGSTRSAGFSFIPFTPSLFPGPLDGTISIQGGSSLLSYFSLETPLPAPRGAPY